MSQKLCVMHMRNQCWGSGAECLALLIPEPNVEPTSFYLFMVCTCFERVEQPESLTW